MKKAVLMAFDPIDCNLIFNGEKVVDVRKVAPNLEPPYTVYMYMVAAKERFPLWEYITAYTNNKGEIINGSQRVVGEFVCDRVDWFVAGGFFCDAVEELTVEALSCLSYEEMIDYFYKPEELNGNIVKTGRALHISTPKIYDTPKELSEFSRYGYQKIECAESGCGNEQCRHCEPAEVIAGLYKPPMCKRGNCIITRAPRSFCYVEEK